MNEPAATRLLYRNDQPLERRLTTYRLTVRGARAASTEIHVRTCRIGSREGNDLVVDDGSVSRLHASIEVSAEGYLLRDLGSTNGTFVAMGLPSDAGGGWLRVREVWLPVRPTLLRLGTVEVELAPAEREVALPLSEVDRFGGALGRSAAMRELFSMLERAAAKEITILLEGESGTGKEVLAEAIHAASPRKGAPFVVFDCAAVPESLMESELFGHERGAFTGAAASHTGRFEEADGGTLFLDELGELPLELQPKLLRVLEKREVRRVGGSRSVPVDVRVVAATNRNLAEEVNRGAFREDLYYRLAVLPLVVPPLRERAEDLPLLVEHFVRRACRDEPARGHLVLRSINPERWRALAAHPWRGNVRELRNFVERSLALGDTILAPVSAQSAAGVEGAEASPSVGRAPAPGGRSGGRDSAVVPTHSDRDDTKSAARSSLDGAVDFSLPFSEVKATYVERVERAYLLGQLERHAGNLSAAARASGLDRMYFKRLLKKYAD